MRYLARLGLLKFEREHDFHRTLSVWAALGTIGCALGCIGAHWSASFASGPHGRTHWVPARAHACWVLAVWLHLPGTPHRGYQRSGGVLGRGDHQPPRLFRPRLGRPLQRGALSRGSHGGHQRRVRAGGARSSGTMPGRAKAMGRRSSRLNEIALLLIRLVVSVERR